MALLDILEFPDPRLRTKAKPIKTVTDKISKLADDMLETMYAAPGIGLAATQINVHQRMLVLDVSDDKSEPMVFINPMIIEQDGLLQSDEGCLSIPGFYEPVERFETITVKALDKHGEEFTLEAQDLLSICIQHEMDHLEGKLFVDYLSGTKRQLIRKRLLKQQKLKAQD